MPREKRTTILRVRLSKEEAEQLYALAELVGLSQSEAIRIAVSRMARDTKGQATGERESMLRLAGVPESTAISEAVSAANTETLDSEAMHALIKHLALQVFHLGASVGHLKAELGELREQLTAVSTPEDTVVSVEAGMSWK